MLQIYPCGTGIFVLTIAVLNTFYHTHHAKLFQNQKQQPSFHFFYLDLHKGQVVSLGYKTSGGSTSFNSASSRLGGIRFSSKKYLINFSASPSTTTGVLYILAKTKFIFIMHTCRNTDKEVLLSNVLNKEKLSFESRSKTVLPMLCQWETITLLKEHNKFI